MKKKMQNILILIIFLITIFNMNFVNADELIGTMNVYKIKIKLLNIDTSEYTIELIDGIYNRIYETQEGNESGEHHFAIATDMDERHLVNYGIKVKFKNGDVKDFGSIKVAKLIDIDEDKTDSSYNFEYNVRVKLLPKNAVIGICVALVIVALIVLIIYLKKHKRRIK